VTVALVAGGAKCGLLVVGLPDEACRPTLFSPQPRKSKPRFFANLGFARLACPLPSVFDDGPVADRKAV
jgi:hypothetical protein